MKVLIELDLGSRLTPEELKQLTDRASAAGRDESEIAADLVRSGLKMPLIKPRAKKARRAA